MSEHSPSPKKKRWRWVFGVGVVCFLAYSFSVQKHKKSCLESETLRVEIGGEKFAFPRKIINSVQGDDVINIVDSRDVTASPSKACQLGADPVWKIDSIILHMHPKMCAPEEPQCGNKISVNVADLEDFKRSGGVNTFPKTRKFLLQKCMPPINPSNDWHAKYWDVCDYAFEDAGLSLRIIFRGGGGMYPPEQIEETKAMVMQAIRQYHIQ